MSERTRRPPRSVIFRWIAVGLWWLALFYLTMSIDIDDDVLFALVVAMVPGLILAVFLLAIPVWMLVAAGIGAYRRQWRKAGFRLAVPIVGVFLVLAGQFAGDQWLIHVMGAGLEQALADAKAGRKVADPFSATPEGAYVETGSFFDMAQGVAYDETGKLREMLDLDVDKRPLDWIKRMPQAFSCYGGARHLGGHYWRTNLDRLMCRE